MNVDDSRGCAIASPNKPAPTTPVATTATRRLVRTEPGSARYGTDGDRGSPRTASADCSGRGTSFLTLEQRLADGVLEADQIQR